MEFVKIFDTRTHNFPYACFDCRKSFKRPITTYKPQSKLAKGDMRSFYRQAWQRLLNEVRPCPDCGGFSYFMGQDFKAPKRIDRKGWEKARQHIIAGGIYYHGKSTDISSVRRSEFEKGEAFVKAFSKNS